LIEKVKSISRRRWNPEGKYWEVPYSDGLIAKLQNLFGENLVIDPYFYLIPLQRELSIRKYSKFYYGKMLNKKFIYQVKRPKKDKKLPVVLSKVEIYKILNAPSNIKHRRVRQNTTRT
jgi:hypothetical protein